MKIGRNDPCHCGSGRKYKKCCLPHDEVISFDQREQQKLHRIAEQTVSLLMYFADQLFGATFLDYAWSEYVSVALEPLSMETAPEAPSSFIPWVLFDYSPTSDRGESFALSFLETNGADLDPFQRKFLTEACRAPMTFWQIEDVEPGRSLTLQDLFTNARHIVQEEKLSTILSTGDVIYSRVVALEGSAMIFGMAACFLPEDFLLDIVDFRNEVFGSRKITNFDLKSQEEDLRELYFELRDAVLNPELPVENADGESFVLNALTYELNCSVRDAFNQLQSLNSTDSDLMMLADATYDESGEMTAIEFPWIRKEDRQQGSVESTILGSFELKTGSLMVAVNSDERAQVIQEEIARRFGDQAVLKDSVSKPVAELFAEIIGKELAQESQKEDQEGFEAQPEFQLTKTRRSTAKAKEPVPLYQLKVTLKGTKRPVWRRILVRSDMTLDRLHNVIQRAMGWTNSHLHNFELENRTYGIPDYDELDWGPPTLNEKRYAIADIAPQVRKSFTYRYDFGDDWEHKVVLEKVLPADPEFLHPVCLGGANACPPEDCGGIGGYSEMLEILADEDNPERADFEQWLGYEFDPEYFDLALTNQSLRRMKA
jgi:hypothetical protein